MKIFEYMAAAKPIIASDLPVLREVLNDSNAILVDPEDIDAWRDALAALRDAETQGSGRKAHEQLLRSYTWQARASRVLG